MAQHSNTDRRNTTISLHERSNRPGEKGTTWNEDKLQERIRPPQGRAEPSAEAWKASRERDGQANPASPRRISLQAEPAMQENKINA